MHSSFRRKHKQNQLPRKQVRKELLEKLGWRRVLDEGGCPSFSYAPSKLYFLRCLEKLGWRRVLDEGGCPSFSYAPSKLYFLRCKKSRAADQVILTQPLVVRIFHWGFALSMVIIILTGFELHSPFTFLNFNYGRVFEIHLTFAWLSLALAALRLVDAIVRKDTSLVPKRSDFKGFLGVLAYYFFLRDNLPPGEKYNSGQKFIFFSWFIVFTVASLLGIASYFMGEHLMWVWHLAGGWQVVRWVKFTAAIYFSATILVHVYLSLTEDLSRLQAMVTGYERREP